MLVSAWKWALECAKKKERGRKRANALRPLTIDDAIEEHRTMALQPIYARIGFLQAEQHASGAHQIGGAA